MEALTPASPGSLPPLGELIADVPFWRFPRGGMGGKGVAHLRVWLTAGPEPGHLAVVTETGTEPPVSESARRIWAELARRYGPSVVLLEHRLAPETEGAAEASPVTSPQRPDQATLMTMAYGYIHAWLVEHYWTIARIVAALQDNGATMDQVAETISLAAAALLTDAFGGSSVRAAQLVAGRISETAGRQARYRAA
jgi:lambda repressor-like predicted transcriptional regulator